MKRVRLYSVFVLLLSLLTSSLTATASSPADFNFEQELALYPLPDDVADKPTRFSHLRKLLGISSGAKKVLSSDNLEAQQVYLEARKMYLSAFNEVDPDAANIQLDQIVKLMYKAIKLASPKQLLDRKKLRDYKRKLLSVNALLEALDRIATEKNNTANTDKLKFEIDQLVMLANEQIGNRDIDKARSLLDEAYLLTKTGIENMRSGDVLVRELKFNSPEEEYVYELERNDSHQMLVKLLIDKKLSDKSPEFKQKLGELVRSATEIRQQAQGLANEAQFKEAITELEKSTKELIKAIRMGGVFIPG